jgi:hypothetical protein
LPTGLGSDFLSLLMIENILTAKSLNITVTGNGNA